MTSFTKRTIQNSYIPIVQLLKELSNQMDSMVMIVSRDTMLSSSIEILSSLHQAFHTPSSIISLKIRSNFTLRIKEVLDQLQSILIRNFLPLPKWEYFLISTSINILPSNSIGYCAKEHNAHILLSTFQEVEIYSPQQEVTLTICSLFGIGSKKDFF